MYNTNFLDTYYIIITFRNNILNYVFLLEQEHMNQPKWSATGQVKMKMKN